MVWFPHIVHADGRPWDDRGTTEVQEFEMAEASLPGVGRQGRSGIVQIGLCCRPFRPREAHPLWCCSAPNKQDRGKS